MLLYPWILIQWMLSFLRFDDASLEDLSHCLDKCAICWEGMEKAKKLKCGHLFHRYWKCSKTMFHLWCLATLIFHFYLLSNKIDRCSNKILFCFSECLCSWLVHDSSCPTCRHSLEEDMKSPSEQGERLPRRTLFRYRFSISNQTKWYIW